MRPFRSFICRTAFYHFEHCIKWKIQKRYECELLPMHFVICVCVYSIQWYTPAFFGCAHAIIIDKKSYINNLINFCNDFKYNLTGNDIFKIWSSNEPIHTFIRYYCCTLYVRNGEWTVHIATHNPQNRSHSNTEKGRKTERQRERERWSARVNEKLFVSLRLDSWILFWFDEAK